MSILSHANIGTHAAVEEWCKKYLHDCNWKIRNDNKVEITTNCSLVSISLSSLPPCGIYSITNALMVFFININETDADKFPKLYNCGRVSFTHCQLPKAVKSIIIPKPTFFNNTEVQFNNCTYY